MAYLHRIRTPLRMQGSRCKFFVIFFALRDSSWCGIGRAHAMRKSSRMSHPGILVLNVATLLASRPTRHTVGTHLPCAPGDASLSLCGGETGDYTTSLASRAGRTVRSITESCHVDLNGGL